MKKSGTVFKAWGWLPPSWKPGPGSQGQPPMAQQQDGHTDQKQIEEHPPKVKHKLARWKDSWIRESHLESSASASASEVVQEQQQGPMAMMNVCEGGGGERHRGKRIAGNPDGPVGGDHRREEVVEAAAGAEAAVQVQTQEEPRGMRVAVVRHKRSRQVLFVEAGKEFVDVVLGLLALPSWAVLRLLKSDSRPSPSVHLNSSGCIQNLYESVREMDPALLVTHKSNLLMGEGALSCFLPSLLYLSSGAELQAQTVRRSNSGSSNTVAAASRDEQRAGHGGDGCQGAEFIYGCHGRYVANGIYGPGHQPCPWIAWAPGTRCPSCGNIMTMLYGQVEASKKRKRHSHNSKRKLTLLPDVSDPKEAAPATAPATLPVAVYGAVKDNVTFMLTDGLEVFPASGTRSLELLARKRWAIGDLEKVSLELGHVEVKRLMELSLTSETVLTDILAPLMR